MVSTMPAVSVETYNAWELRTIRVLVRLLAERRRQVARYGHNRSVTDGTGEDVRWIPRHAGGRTSRTIEQEFRLDLETWLSENDHETWVHLVREEIAEAFCETTPARLREELLQSAALIVAWIEQLDARILRESGES